MTEKLGNIFRDHWLVIVAVLSLASAWGASTVQISYLSSGQDRMSAKVDARFDVLSAKLDSMSSNVVQAQTRLEDVKSDVTRLEQRLYMVESAKH